MKSMLARFLFVISPVLVAGAQTSNAIQPSGRLLPFIGLQVQAVPMRSALPGIFDQAGHERRTLTGSATLAGGAVVPLVFTREMDQKVRIDFGSPARTICVTGLNSLAKPQTANTGSNLSSIDQDILEVLADDAAEALLFSFGTTARIRWLGEKVRIDEGRSAPYSGPYFDVYARTAVAGTQETSPNRVKMFFFDSTTKLLSLTRYRVERNGSNVEVEIAFKDWVSLSGQMVPTTIIRSENNQEVFTIAITAASSSVIQTDSFFTL